VIRLRALLQPIAFEQPDDGQHDPDDADIAVVVERLAKRRHDRQWIKSCGEACGKGGKGHHKQWIETSDEADHDDEYSRQDQHASPRMSDAQSPLLCAHAF
jgi:hypothetical protein